MALSSPGIGSNLDVNSIVSQLMALERRPLTALDTKEARFQARLSAYGSLKGALSAFQSAAASLASPARFSAAKASIADASVLTASAVSTAVAGSHSIEVTALAQAHKLTSTPFTNTTSTVGSGTLTIQFGSYSGETFTANGDSPAATITINSSDNSLAAIRDAINQAKAGVTASLVNDGSGYRLVMASDKTGLSNALRISITDDDGNHTNTEGLSQLVHIGTTSGTKNMTQTVAAQNAALTVDGIAVSKASNTVTDVIQGVTLTILKTNAGSATTLSVAKDTAGIKSAVDGFAKAYNDLNKLLVDVSKYDPANKQASILTGDATVRSVQSRLRNLLNTSLTTAGGGLATLSDAGIGFQADGTLKVDATKLNAVLADPTKDLATLFAAVGKPSDSLVSFAGSTADTKNGSYAVSISQLAARGSAVGGVPAGLTIVSGSNDTLNLTVDGVAASIALSAGTYTAATLAAELQSKINGATGYASAGIAVTVSQSGGVLTVASNRYGSASTVSLTGGNSLADMFGTPVVTAGLDVAGSIGGSTAAGSGQKLTAASGDANGLALNVIGGNTGDRGSVQYARGFAYELDKLVGAMLENDGLVDSRMDGINASIKGISSRREALELRMVTIERRFRAQFTALDTLIASMTTTSNFLQQQLANLPKSGGSQ